MKVMFFEPRFTPDTPRLLKRLGLVVDSDEAIDFLQILDKAVPLARPKAAFIEAHVDRAAEDGTVTIDGVDFFSRLLASNLRGVETVWPYMVTCGREIYDFAMAIPDPFERYWADEIMQEALAVSRAALDSHLSENVYGGKTAFMSPGSIEDWPIGEQAPMFRLLGSAPERLGVTLTDSLLMLPNKSVSGIRFPNEDGYVNCQLCSRDRCPSRKAPYDAEAALGM